MKNRRIFTFLGLILLGAGLVVGFLEILDRRFAEGGVYAHYASFRSDPLGVSAFYESLDSLPGTTVSRNQTNLNRIETLDSETVLLLLGYPRDGVDDLRAPEDSPVMKAVEEGGRLVLTVNPGLVPERFRPVQDKEAEDWFERRRQLQEDREAEKQAKTKPEQTAEKKEKEEGGGEASEGEGAQEAEPSKEEESDEEEFEREMAESIGERLLTKIDIDLDSLTDFERPEDGWEVERGSDADNLPSGFPNWYSQFRFTSLSEDWTVVAKSDDAPVLVERSWGKGTIVLASDSYFVSNEALYREAYPELLLWILGGKTKVVFDETIHGVQENGGAMKLMRRYRVHGVLFGLLFVVLLWAWRSASSLAPGSEELDRGLVGTGSQVSGEETEVGLTGLLRRSIPVSNLFPKCLEVWEGSTRSLTPEQETKKEEVLQRHLSNPKVYTPVKAYRDMIALLRRR